MFLVKLNGIGSGCGIAAMDSREIKTGITDNMMVNMYVPDYNTRNLKMYSIQSLVLVLSSGWWLGWRDDLVLCFRGFGGSCAVIEMVPCGASFHPDGC